MQSIRCKLFVLVLARTELLERWPALAEGRGRTRVDLAPLSQEAMAALLDGLVAELAVRARAALVARAEGVPLYAVETVRSLIDQDAVVARDGQYVFVDHDHAIVDLERLTAPTSLQTLIAARLDALSAVERRTVQDASVLGMTFRYGSLLALTGTSSHALDDALAGLVGKGVLETQVDPRSPELGQYRFLQAMVREVAYSTLARSRSSGAAPGGGRAADPGGGGGERGAGGDHRPAPARCARGQQRDRPRAARPGGAGPDPADHGRDAGRRARGARGGPGQHPGRLALDPDDGERYDLQLRAARVAALAGQPTLAEQLAVAGADGFERTGDTLGGREQPGSGEMWACVQLGRVREAEELALRADRLAAGEG